MVESHKKQFKNKNGLIIFSALVFLLALFLLARNKLFSASQESNRPEATSEIPTSTPFPSPYPIDMENDGVYTNYQYRFRFKYPLDIFKYQTKDFELSSIKEGHPNNLKNNEVTLWILPMPDFTVDELKYGFFEIYSMKDGESIKDKGLQKIKNMDTNSYKSVIYTVDSTGRAVDRSYSVVARINKDELIIELSLFVASPDQIQKRTELLENIVSSFEFF